MRRGTLVGTAFGQEPPRLVAQLLEFVREVEVHAGSPPRNASTARLNAAGWCRLAAWPASVDHHLRRAGDLARHVVGGSQEVGVVAADQHEARHRDRVQRCDHRVVALRQHAARRAGQAGRIAVLAHAHLVAGAERREAARIQIVRPLPRALVPRFARLGVAEAGAGVEDHQRARHRRDARDGTPATCSRRATARRSPRAARRRRAGSRPCPRRWLPRNKRRDRPDSRFGRGRACPTRSPGTVAQRLRSGRPTCGRSRCSRGTAGLAGPCPCTS